MPKAIRYVVRVTSDVSTACKECGALVTGTADFTDTVNHYLEEHKYRLLHVGSEAATDYNGERCHITVAIAGSDKAPKKRKGTKSTEAHR
jgi:hypothetical protein